MLADGRSTLSDVQLCDARPEFIAFASKRGRDRDIESQKMKVSKRKNMFRYVIDHVP
jgi:hypothetical protein